VWEWGSLKLKDVNSLQTFIKNKIKYYYYITYIGSLSFPLLHLAFIGLLLIITLSVRHGWRTAIETWPASYVGVISPHPIQLSEENYKRCGPWQSSHRMPEWSTQVIFCLTTLWGDPPTSILVGDWVSYGRTPALWVRSVPEVYALPYIVVVF